MNWNRGAFPSFPRRGGCEPRKYLIATLSGAAGVDCVVFKNNHGCATPGTGSDLGGAQTPLLGKEGNIHDSNFIHSPLLSRAHNSFTPHRPRPQNAVL